MSKRQIIQAQEDQEHVVTWQMPCVEETRSRSKLLSSHRTNIHDVDAEKAYDEAFKRGYQDGLNAAKQELQAQAKTLQALHDCLADAWKLVNEQVTQELLQLVIGICQSLIGQAITEDESRLLSVIEAALRHVPMLNDSYDLILNPDDLAYLSKVINDDSAEKHCRYKGDPSLLRGDFMVETSRQTSDGRLATRIKQIVDDTTSGESSE